MIPPATPDTDPTAAALAATLSLQRAHVSGILADVDADSLMQPMLPTGWSAAGLVQHLAVDVERFWFRAVVAGEQAAWDSFDTTSAWTVAPDTDPLSVLALYREEISRSDQIIASTPLNAAPQRWPAEVFGDFRLPDLRAVLLHVITETACHAGHLDAARELIDGRTWLVLP